MEIIGFDLLKRLKKCDRVKPPQAPDPPDLYLHVLEVVMQDVLKMYNDELLAEIRAIENLNQVASLRNRRDRANKISKECTSRIIDLIYDAKDNGLRITQIAAATGYSPSYIKDLLKRRRLGFTDRT
jgi:hypothetical protein